jgi:hypothetical protein
MTIARIVAAAAAAGNQLALEPPTAGVSASWDLGLACGQAERGASFLPHLTQLLARMRALVTGMLLVSDLLQGLFEPANDLLCEARVAIGSVNGYPVLKQRPTCGLAGGVAPV